MTISGYSNAIVDVMLGWLKGIANWVLRLFNLAGSSGASPLLWLSNNWLKLLIFFLVLGLVLDRLVWLIRWRPYWVWFRKERVIVNDDKFFAHANLEGDEDWDDGLLEDNWEERDYVVTSSVVKRPAGQRQRNGRPPVERPAARQPQKARPQRQIKDAEVRRREGGESRSTDGHKGKAERRSYRLTSSVKTDETPRRGSRRPANVPIRRARPHAHAMAGKRRYPARQAANPRIAADPVGDKLFGIDTNQPDASDFYEDEVFNVSNLPIGDEFQGENRQT